MSIVLDSVKHLYLVDFFIHAIGGNDKTHENIRPQIQLRNQLHHESEKGGKGQEFIQSSTTPAPGHYMGK